jgi:hypothetical protein
MLGKAKRCVSTNSRLLGVVYAKDPFTVSVKVTNPNTLKLNQG